MIRPANLTDKQRKILYVAAHYDRSDAGWYAINSVNPRDCRPEYRLAGGGVSSKYLTDLPEAIEQSIIHLKQRKAECDRLIKKLESIR